MRFARHSLHRAPLLVLLAACGGAGGASGGRAAAPLEPTTRDSAGVAIHEHQAGALDRAPLVTIDSAPLAVFAGDLSDPDRDVSTLTGFRFTASGVLIGIDNRASTFTVLDPATGTRRSHGRKGSGPLELGVIGQFALAPGDTLLLTDFANLRVLVATATAGPIRTESYAEAGAMSLSMFMGRSSTGALLARRITFGAGAAPGSGEPIRRSIVLGVWRPGQDSLTGSFSVPGALSEEQMVEMGGRTVMTLREIPLAAAPTFAVWDDGFMVARGDAWRLERWDTTGTLRSVIAVDHSRRLVTPEIWERWVDDNIRQRMSFSPIPEDSVGLVRERTLAQSHADTLPAYGNTRVTPNGTVWVQDQELTHDAGWAATAFDADGRLLGRVEADSGEAPIAWGDDRLAFRTEDDLGIATISVHRLRIP